jgi:hypothetical protein
MHRTLADYGYGLNTERVHVITRGMIRLVSLPNRPFFIGMVITLDRFNWMTPWTCFVSPLSALSSRVNISQDWACGVPITRALSYPLRFCDLPWNNVIHHIVLIVKGRAREDDLFCKVHLTPYVSREEDMNASITPDPDPNNPTVASRTRCFCTPLNFCPGTAYAAQKHEVRTSFGESPCRVRAPLVFLEEGEGCAFSLLLMWPLADRLWLFSIERVNERTNSDNDRPSFALYCMCIAYQAIKARHGAVTLS